MACEDSVAKLEEVVQELREVQDDDDDASIGNDLFDQKISVLAATLEAVEGKCQVLAHRLHAAENDSEVYADRWVFCGQPVAGVPALPVFATHRLPSASPASTRLRMSEETSSKLMREQSSREHLMRQEVGVA